jgi:hypothetical protein
MQYGVLVTSASLAGSQKLIGIPGTSNFTPPTSFIHKHGIVLGLFVSSLPPEYKGMFPILIGNIQLQHISVIGFTNFPTHGSLLAFSKLLASINIIVIICNNGFVFFNWSHCCLQVGLLLFPNLIIFHHL